MSIVFRIHEISHEIDVLTSLVQVLVAQIEAVTEHIDHDRAAKVAADLARIAFDALVAVIADLASVEAQLVVGEP
jgi:hypothetical protein